MEIVNSTPIPVTVAVTGDVEGEPRTAILTAKATFRMESGGKVEVERDEPYGILDEDQPTDFGLLPRDNLPKVDPAFEVLLLGQAHASGGNPVEQMKIALSVGSVRRELDVIGDRFWMGEGEEAKPSRPDPFKEMPLVYERAYGGRAEVLIDVESPVEVSDPINQDGKGFDHVAQAREIGKLMKAPEGFPQYEKKRELPNLEDPANRIRRWSDTRIPACWATPPLHSGMVAERLRRKQAANPDRELRLGEPEMLHRAHPDWIIETPAAAAEVVIEGVDPKGKLAFNLPERRVVCDLQIGEESSSLELIPRMLVLLPEDRKLYIVYRSFLQFPYNAEETRVVRVREEDGWTTPSGAK